MHNRNIKTNSSLVMHIGDGSKAIIVEGDVRHETPERDVAQRLPGVSNTKYAHYGMEQTAHLYTSRGTCALKARRVLAWTNLPEDATRFLF